MQGEVAQTIASSVNVEFTGLERYLAPEASPHARYLTPGNTQSISNNKLAAVSAVFPVVS